MVIAQDAQSDDPPTVESEPSESTPTEESGSEKSTSERLNPETDTPEEGMVIGDGDDMSIVGNFVQIHGNALIKFEDVTLRADHVWADFDDNLMRASGNVHLKVGTEETYSDELIFNLKNKKGIARNGFTYSDPWYFGGSEIFKIGEERSYIRGATLTTCSLKHPHYYFSVTEVIVQMNQELIAKNIVLRIGGFPLFYFPAIRRDLRKGKVAKIVVKLGTDSYQGPYISIIQPLVRKQRYDAALLYDRSARRGQGYGFEGKYRFADTKFQEIYIPIPPDVTPNQRTKLEEKAQELQDWLDGEYDRYWLEQIFLEYKITDEDVTRAKERAEEVLKQLQEEGADFAELAQRNSDHSDTRYDGGDLGFLARGEIDEDGNPKLDPVIEEAAFALKEGEITPIVQTESAFHILKADRIIDVYGEREIKLRRIDIAITPSDDSKDALRVLADDMLQRAQQGEPFEQLVQLPDGFTETAEPVLSEINEGKGLPLNEMDSSWQSSVRRLEKPGDVIERRPITTPEGLYIFKLIRKEETPTFQAIAEEFEAEWETFFEDLMNPAPEQTEEEAETDETKQGTTENTQPQETDAVPTIKEPVSEPDATDIDDAQNAEQHETEEDVQNGVTPNQSEDIEKLVPEPDADNTQNAEQNEAGGDKQNGAAPNQNETDSQDLITEEGTNEATEGEAALEDEEELKIYRRHGFRGRWEDPGPLASEAQSLYAGELSRRPIQTEDAFRLIEVDRKRTYRGDLYIYGSDVYSAQRQSAVRTGNRWIMRWAHTHSIYTPWDNRQAGRRPISFTGRTEFRSQRYKEEFQLPTESSLYSFAIVTYGSGFSTIDLDDRDDNGNLNFSTETIGDFTSRLEVRHIHDFTGEGTRSLQKLPQLTVNFSRMRLSAFPFFEALNDRLVTVSEKLNTEKPFLSLFAFPTLETTSFDLDIELGNFYREIFRGKAGEERDVYLQTMDLGFDVRKQSTLLITPLRELQLNLNLNTNMVWHDRDQDQNTNIFRNVFSFNGSATNTLFRIYNVSYIPGLRKLRHEIQSTLRYDYQPAVDRDDNLYPFGPSTYFYERKRLTYNFNTAIEIKTRRSQSAHRVMHFDTRLTADFTEFDPLYERQFEPIESDFTIFPLPSRNLNMTFRFTHDPNPHPDDGKQFKMVGFRSNIRYTRKTWNVSVGSSFSNRHTARRASRSITATGRYRVSRNLEFDASVIYYPIDGQFYQQRLSMTRNLHDWNLRISWSRVGIKREPPYDNVRQDFTFQVNLIEEPAVSMGIGYDATTETWGIRTVPAGVPYNAFGAGNSLGRSYF